MPLPHKKAAKLELYTHRQFTATRAEDSSPKQYGGAPKAPTQVKLHLQPPQSCCQLTRCCLRRIGLRQGRTTGWKASPKQAGGGSFKASALPHMTQLICNFSLQAFLQQQAQHDALCQAQSAHSRRERTWSGLQAAPAQGPSYRSGCGPAACTACRSRLPAAPFKGLQGNVRGLGG